MKKKTIAIVIILVLACALIAFLFINKDDKRNDPYDGGDQSGTTIQDVLSMLEEEGYEKIEEGYVKKDTSGELSSEQIVSADGNEMELILKYDYGEGNSNMKTYYREQDEAVYVVVSDFLAKLGTEAGISDANMHYTIYIGDEAVREGDMDLQEALEYQKLAQD